MPPSDTKIGTFYILDPKVAANCYRALAFTYLTVFFSAALGGPKTFFLVAWRIGVVLLAYELMRRKFNWKDSLATDVVLAPVQDGLEEAQQVVQEVVQMLCNMLTPIIVATIQVAVEEYEISRSG